MATNDFKPFAVGSSANVMTQSDYEVLPALTTGFQAGKASSAQVNKALRQGTSMASLIGQFISLAGVDALDTGNQEMLLDGFLVALNKNLSLGVASKRDVGEEVNQLPDMSSYVSVLNMPGYIRIPGGFTLQWTLGSTDANGAANVTFPIKFTSIAIGALAIERNPYAWGGGISNTWAIQLSTLTLTGVQAICRQASSNTIGPVNNAGCILFSWGK